MANFNKVILAGNLTRDPELRVTPKGTSICRISLAVNRTYKGSDGSDQEETTFVDVEAWGKQGEVIAKYVGKGRPLLVEGRLKTDSWTDQKTNEKRSKLKVVMEEFQFLGGNREGGASAEGGSGGAGRSGYSSGPSAGSTKADPGSYGNKDTDEDVPF
jgi:single-strand DNA-binding protein